MNNCCSVVRQLQQCYGACRMQQTLQEESLLQNYELWVEYCQVSNPACGTSQGVNTYTPTSSDLTAFSQQEVVVQSTIQQQQQIPASSASQTSSSNDVQVNPSTSLTTAYPAEAYVPVQGPEEPIRLSYPASNPTEQGQALTTPTVPVQTVAEPAIAPAPQPTQVPVPTPTTTAPTGSSADLLAGYSDAIKQEVAKFEERVNIVAKAAVTGYNRRALHAASCECMHSWCSNALSNTSACGFDLGSDQDFCGTCEGVMYDSVEGYIGLPPGSNPDNLTTALKASACLMNSINEAIPELKALDTNSWAYIGLTTGAFWTWPGRMRGRAEDGSGEEYMNQCNSYDPRQRPWYHAGSTGPKDVVIVIDKSESMNELVTRSFRRWDILMVALEKMLDTFTSADWLNVVAFNHKAHPLYLNEPLVQGTEENRAVLKELLAELEPNGNTNFDDGIQKAIEQLIEAQEQGMTSDCTKIIIFLTDGRDNLMEIDNQRAQEILDNIDNLQEQLEASTGQRALIFTYSMGSQADDSIPRQIACRNNGQWAHISDDDDPTEALNGYQVQVAAARSPNRYSWSDPYVDSSGLGEMLSIVKPVYTPEIDDNLPGVIFGVASHDVLLEDLKVVAGPQYDEVLELLIAGSRQCDELKVNTCQQQVYRGLDLECPDLLETEQCYQHEGRFYLRSQEQLPWGEAKATCEAAGGKLTSIRSDKQLSIVAGMSNPQGSWIGLHYSDDKEWVWEDPDVLPIDHSSAYWGLFEPNDYKGSSEDCVEVDPRGTTGNLNDLLCDKDLTYICEFEDKSGCGAATIVNIDQPTYTAKTPRIEDCVADEALASMNFFEEAEIQTEEVVCNMGPEERDFKELICCPDCV